MCTIYISADSPRKVHKMGLSYHQVFALLGWKHRNNNPGASRTPSTLYNAGQYFESDCTMGNNLIIKTKHKTTYAISRASDQIYQGLSLFSGEELGYEAILQQLYCHRYYWQDCFLPFNLAGVCCILPLLICREHTDHGWPWPSGRGAWPCFSARWSCKCVWAMVSLRASAESEY